MFPYCATIYSLSALFGIVISIRLYYAWKESRAENVGLFFKALALATTYFVLSALPGVLVKAPILGGIIYIISWIPFYLALLYFTRIAFNFWHLARMKQFFSAMIIFLVVLTTVLGIIDFSPTEMTTYKNLTVCFERAPSWILTLNGAIITFLLLTNSMLFFVGGVRSGEKVVKKRGITIGIGLFVLTLSALAKYVLAPNYLEAQFFIFFAGPLLLLGILLLYFGIRYKGAKNEDSIRLKK
jgi:hypothetical protein